MDYILLDRIRGKRFNGAMLFLIESMIRVDGTLCHRRFFSPTLRGDPAEEKRMLFA
jgi:hypothetical protein